MLRESKRWKRSHVKQLSSNTKRKYRSIHRTGKNRRNHPRRLRFLGVRARNMTQRPNLWLIAHRCSRESRLPVPFSAQRDAIRTSSVSREPRAHACTHARMLPRNIIAVIGWNWGSPGLTRVLEASTCRAAHAGPREIFIFSRRTPCSDFRLPSPPSATRPFRYSRGEYESRRPASMRVTSAPVVTEFRQRSCAPVLRWRRGFEHSGQRLARILPRVSKQRGSLIEEC